MELGQDDSKGRAVARALLILGILSGLMFPCPVTADQIYWTEFFSFGVRRASPDGLDEQAIVSDGASDVDVDTVHGRVYWIYPRDFEIRRSDINGSNVQTLIPRGITVNPLAIALDPRGGKMYWSDEFRPIRRSNLDGSSIEDLIPIQRAVGIALDIDEGKIYWSEFFTNMIRRANLDGTNVEDVVFAGYTAGLAGIALDPKNRKIYWCDWRNEKIARANLDGTNAEDVIQKLLSPSGVAIDSMGGRMFWTTGAGSLERANLDGSQRTVLRVNSGSLGGIKYVPTQVNEPPSAQAGADQIIECTGNERAIAFLDGSASTDADSSTGTNDDITSFVWSEDGFTIATGESASATFSVGAHSVLLTVTDRAGEQDTDSVEVTVQDTTPPLLSAAVRKPRLWPPDSKLKDVGLDAEISDCDPEPVVEVDVFSNEADSPGDGRGRSRDAKNLALGSLLLRAERNAKGNGRVYLIVTNAVDLARNRSYDCMSVVVPHDMTGASLDRVEGDAAAAIAYCRAHGGAPPPGYSVVGRAPYRQEKRVDINAQ